MFLGAMLMGAVTLAALAVSKHAKGASLGAVTSGGAGIMMRTQ